MTVLDIAPSTRRRGRRQLQMAFDDLERFVHFHFGPDPNIHHNQGLDRLCTDGFIAHLCDRNRGVVLRWRRANQIPLDSADSVAIRLGVHPIEIWSNFHHIED